jgi:hypothetical protein
MTSFARRVFILVVLLYVSGSAWAAKTDIVYFRNGDHITGEVKGLELGKLEFSTDHMGTVYIEWDDIEEVVSTTGQAVELTNGQRFYGPLAKSENQHMVLVNTDSGTVSVSTDDVINMYPVEAGFWDRLDIYANLGFSWDKGSEVGKYNVGIDAELRNPKYITSASLTSEVTTQQGRDDTARANLDAMHLLFRENRKYAVFFGALENNDELGIDLRVLLGAAYGKMPIRTQRNRLGFGAGLAVNHEIPVDGQEETDLEAVGMVTYNYFKYSDPERSLSSDFRVFPSLTNRGRWRATFDTSFRLELISDFFWNMSVYASYDNDPISADAASSDYGVTSSLAYKF